MGKAEGVVSDEANLLARQNCAFLVKAAREKAGLTQQRLADGCGVSQGTIAHIENVIDGPTIENLRRIAAVCGATMQIAFVYPGDRKGTLKVDLSNTHD